MVAKPKNTYQIIDITLDELDTQYMISPLDVCEKLERMLIQTREGGDIVRTARILSMLAWARARACQYEAALLVGYEGLLLSREHGVLAAELHTVGAIAFVFRVCGLKHEAATLFKYALEQYEAHQDEFHETVEGRARHGLAVNADTMSRFDLGERDDIIESLHYALRLIPPESKYGCNQALVLNNIATVYGQIGLVESALPYTQEAFELAQRAGSSTLIVQIEFNFASLNLIRGDVEQAKIHTERARAAYADKTVNINTIQIALHEGYIKHTLQKTDAAALAWERAYLLAMESGNLHLAIRALDLLRDLYERQGDYAAANRIFHRLTEEVSRRLEQSSDLRLRALTMVFAQDKTAAQFGTPVSAERATMLERLSHEFRTPLAIIQSSAETLDNYAERMKVEQRQKHLKTINMQVMSLAQMVSNVEALLSETDAALFRPTTPFLECLQQSMKRLDEVGMDTDRIRLAITSPEWYVVPPAMETILFQLLHNALRYSSDIVDLAVSADDGMMQVRISDRGIGIPAQEQRVIFQPFTSASNRNMATGGGFGLALVARYVRELAGTVDLVSRENQGTTMTVRIPLT